MDKKFYSVSPKAKALVVELIKDWLANGIPKEAGNGFIKSIPKNFSKHTILQKLEA